MCRPLAFGLSSGSHLTKLLTSVEREGKRGGEGERDTPTHAKLHPFHEQVAPSGSNFACLTWLPFSDTFNSLKTLEATFYLVHIFVCLFALSN